MTNPPSKIHLALLTDCLADLGGGAEKQIYELAKGLDKDRYSVTIISLDCYGQAPRELIESAGCRLETFRVVRIYGLSGILQGFKFFHYLREHRIDILQTYHFSSDIWGTFWGRLAGVPVIISNRRDMGFWRRGIHVAAYRWVNRWVSKIVVNAKSIRDHIKSQEGISAEKIEVIYNGVDLPSQHAGGFLSDVPVKAPNDILIMHVANLKLIKGHRYLLKAFEGISAQYPNVKLILIGDDTMNGTLQKEAQDLGIKDRTVFLGKRGDVRALLSLADICVLPSLSEGMSNAILEYMAAGKPVVATNVGGNPELVEDEVNGFIVEKEDSEGLKNALLKLIKDGALRESMGMKGRQKAVDQFSTQGMVRRYEEFFSSLVPRPLKVVHFISSGGLFGAENVLLNIAASFNNERYVSIVAALRDDRQEHTEVVEKAAALNIPTHIFKSKGRFDLAVVKELKKFLIDQRVDVLHTHNYKSDIMGALAARGLKVGLVSTAHGFTDSDHKVSAYEALDRWFLKTYFSRVVVVADAVLPGLNVQKKRVIRNGIDTDKFRVDPSFRQRIRTLYGIADGDFLIGTVGRLSVEKNQTLFLEAFKKLSSSGLPVKAMIVGDGPESERLKYFISEHGLTDKVIFTGLIKEVVPFYQAFDIFVLSSLTEGVPMTILEAMASHTVVVATKVGGIPQIIEHGKTGLLVSSQDADGLCAALGSLVGDDNRRRSLADAAFGFVQREYSLERMNQQYSQIYQEASQR